MFPSLLLSTQLKGQSHVEEFLKQLPGGVQRPKPPTIRELHSSIPRSSEPCMITFQESEHNVRMPCGHTISPGGLMDYCWSEVSGPQRKHEIRCYLCNAEWPLDVLYRYSSASREELKMLELGLSENLCQHQSDIMKCPGCGSYCKRRSGNSNCIQCSVCTKQRKSSYLFCWQCRKTWRNSPLANKCGNPHCFGTVSRRPEDTPLVTLMGVDVQVPNVRACPTCRTSIQITNGYKHIVCKECHNEFCCICLRSKTNGIWMCGKHDTACILASQ